MQFSSPLGTEEFPLHPWLHQQHIHKMKCVKHWSSMSSDTLLLRTGPSKSLKASCCRPLFQGPFLHVKTPATFNSGSSRSSKMEHPCLSSIYFCMPLLNFSQVYSYRQNKIMLKKNIRHVIDHKLLPQIEILCLFRIQWQNHMVYLQIVSNFLLNVQLFVD